MREERKEGREKRREGRKAQLVHAVCRNCNTRRGSSGNEGMRRRTRRSRASATTASARSLVRPPFAFVFTRMRLPGALNSTESQNNAKIWKAALDGRRGSARLRAKFDSGRRVRVFDCVCALVCVGGSSDRVTMAEGYASA